MGYGKVVENLPEENAAEDGAAGEADSAPDDGNIAAGDRNGGLPAAAGGDGGDGAGHWQGGGKDDGVAGNAAVEAC